MNYLLAGSIAALIVPATGQTAPSESLSKPTPAKGPLRVHPTNPCYCTDGMKNRDGSLKAIYLAGSHHWNNLQDSGRLGGPLTNRFDYDGYLNRLASLNHNFVRLWAWEGPAWWFQGGQNDQYYEPLPWVRSGRETALDGKPKFDLNQFNDEYFKRLRSRVLAARDKGIYVSVMLFQGWSIYSHGYGNPWPGHPFNQANNVNALNGDANSDGEGKEVHTLEVPSVTRRQEAYLRKVDWVRSGEPEMEGVRQAMGHTRTFAERMNLTAMTPQSALASTRYCLASPGTEYLIYQPKGGEGFSVELRAGTYRYEWFDPAKGEGAGNGNVHAAGGGQQFKAPFVGDSVLYLQRAKMPE